MKKLKLAALILGTVMLLSSCNSPKNTTERTKSSEVKTEAPVENETTFGFNPYTGETITNEKNSDNSTDEKKEPEYPITISADYQYTRVAHLYLDGGAFYRDYAFFTTEKKLTIIDRNGKIFNEIELENGSWSSCKWLCENRIIAKIESDYTYYYTVIDCEGNVIISQKKQEFDNIFGFTDRYVFVCKLQSGFEGATPYFGVLDTDGNWVVPLSSNLNLFKQEIVDFLRFFESDELVSYSNGNSGISNAGTWKYLDENYLIFIKSGSVFIYEFINDVVYAMDNLDNNSYIIGVKNDYLFYTDGNHFIKYNFKQNKDEFDVECANGYDDYINILDNSILLPIWISDEGSNNRLLHKWIDFDGNIIADISDYNIDLWSEKYVINDNLFALCEGKDGNPYLCCISKEGDKVFDPIKLYSNDKISYISENEEEYDVFTEKYFYRIDKNGNIVNSNSFNQNTLNRIEYNESTCEFAVIIYEKYTIDRIEYYDNKGNKMITVKYHQSSEF